MWIVVCLLGFAAYSPYLRMVDQAIGDMERDLLERNLTTAKKINITAELGELKNRRYRFMELVDDDFPTET